MANLKDLFQEFIGYRIMNQQYLPIGLDLEADIRYKLKTEPEVIFDVGANAGQTAIRYHHQFPSASIYSFEPVAGPFQKLLQQTAALPRVRAFHCALGNTQEQLEIPVFPEDRSVLNSLLDNSELLGPGANSEVIRVERTDDFCRANGIGRIDLLKIDTEGYELEVLKGADSLISDRKVKLIYCETGFSPNDKHKVYFPQLLEYLVGKGYILFGFYEMGTYENINKSVPGGSQYGNALFFLP